MKLLKNIQIKNRRLKSESSILKKLEDKGYEPKIENVEKCVHDIVGNISGDNEEMPK